MYESSGFQMDGSTNNTIADQLVQKLIDRIIINGMQPGDRLPSERELSAEYMIGRPSVREAIKTLSVLNVIEVRPYDGIYVASFSPEKLIMPLKIHMEMGKFDFEQIFELRAILETEAIRAACTRISDEKIREIEEIVNTADVENPYMFSEHDKQLHNAIYEQMDNYLIQMMLAMVNEWSSVTRSITNSFLEVRKIVHKDHLDIVEALKRRDEEGSCDAMRQHIQHLSKIKEISDESFRAKFLKSLKDHF